jgi:hypothetical protein
MTTFTPLADIPVTSNVSWFSRISEPAKMSPTMVSITPTGFQVTAEVGWQSHQTDLLVDISITGGHSWTARADYIQ